MKFIVTADTDVGISKAINQDSLLVKRASFEEGQVLMAVICDGMGGLAKGELASATVVKNFSRWFDRELGFELEHTDMEVIGAKWALLLKDLNIKILDYGTAHGESLGTTFSGILFAGEKYVIVHVGDSRIYRLDDTIRQLTTDQTFIAREIRRGTMTKEQARMDKRRNLLLQCVGASKNLEPEVFCGTTQRGAYMLCSDGFRHEITEEEMYQSLRPDKLTNADVMHKNVRNLIAKAKSRQEKDNISAILIKAE